MTLHNLWISRTNITHVAKRTGNPDIYLSCGHDSHLQALANARGKQDITAEDEIADDWYIADAP